MSTYGALLRSLHGKSCLTLQLPCRWRGGVYHERVQPRMSFGQLIHDPLYLAKAEAPMLPILAVQCHIGAIYQHMHWAMLSQPSLQPSSLAVWPHLMVGLRRLNADMFARLLWHHSDVDANDYTV